jgi:hypothetical protein
MPAADPETSVEVIDVERQNSATGHWTLRRWVDYYNTPLDERKQILNVISLEFSKTPLSKIVCLPARPPARLARAPNGAMLPGCRRIMTGGD